MRITHVISCPASGGAEVYVRDLSLAMAAKGHGVSIAFLDRAEEAGRQVAYQEEFLSQLDAAGVNYRFIGHRARRNPILGWLRMRRMLTDWRPDVLHAHLYCGVLFLAFCGTPVVYTRHGIHLRAPRLFYRLVLDRIVSRYVGICTACARVLASTTRRPVVQIDNGVNSARLIKGSEIVGGCDAPFTFLAVGRLVRQKNYPRLLAAMAQIPKERPWRLQIAGEGRHRASLQDLAIRLGLSDRVEFLGNVSNVREQLASASVFVMSSDSEGLPIALIEATLSGLPVVVTNVGGCAEVVHTACNGIVVDESSVEAFALALRRMLDDGELRRCFSRNALQYGSKYDLATSLDKHLELYASLANLPSRLKSR